MTAVLSPRMSWNFLELNALSNHNAKRWVGGEQKKPKTSPRYDYRSLTSQKKGGKKPKPHSDYRLA